MSQVSLNPTRTDGTGFQHRICDPPASGWEKAWVWCGERINPIVVKEIRQSLKSKQFTISFGLTLIAVVGWTLLAISMLVPRIYYLPGGMPLLIGFFCILNFPLLVIVPQSAFRALVAETEDSTFELLSISALSATQIVHGKMASAGVQILLYLSALAPCIVLTYLLRGVGLVSILLALGITILLSITLTAIALLVASAARTRLAQTGISVLLLAALMIAFFFWTGVIMNEGLELFSNIPKEAWQAIVAVISLLAVFISLILKTSAAAIDFPSENNSTPIRLRIVGLFSLALFWAFYATVAFDNGRVLSVCVLFFFAICMLLGGLIAGEHGVISPRAQRGLPKTFLGRIFLTWLYPGAGLGYIFIICLFGSLALAAGFFELVFSGTINRMSVGIPSASGGYILTCYLMLYVGATRLIMLLIPRSISNRMLVSLALLIVLLLFAHLLPLLTVYFLEDYQDFPYAWHQFLNIYWTLGEIGVSGNLEIGYSLFLISIFAIVVFGINLMLVTRDVMLVRIAAPPRVQQEIAQEPAETVVEPDPFADG